MCFQLFMLNTWAQLLIKVDFKNDVQEHFRICVEFLNSTLKFAF